MSDYDPRVGRRDRKADRDNTIKKMIGNGAGLIITRLMIIVGFPLTSALAAYAFNLTMEKFQTGIREVSDEVHQVAKKVEDLNLSEKQTNDAVAGLRIDVTRLQDKQEAMVQMMDRKHQ